MVSGYRLNQHFELEGRRVGGNAPVLIIAEVSANHNNNLATARALIDAASAAGADAVKFQTYRTEEFMADPELLYEYEAGGRKVSEKLFDIYKRYELPLEWYRELFDYARNKKLIPLTSVADQASVDFIDEIGVSAYKLSSEDLINLPLVEYVARRLKPIIVSTGMADEEEIEDFFRVIEAHNLRDVIFLHCVSLYPTPDDEANLLRMEALREKVGGPVGFSDHTYGIEAPLAAVSLGATVIEKHFTLNKKDSGPDHNFSADPVELESLVKSIRRIEKMRGAPRLEPAPAEIIMRQTMRRSIVAARDLKAGDTIKRQDLWPKRPGHGLRPKHIPELLGRRLKTGVKKNAIITFEMLEDEK